MQEHGEGKGKREREQKGGRKGQGKRGQSEEGLSNREGEKSFDVNVSGDTLPWQT